MFFLVIFIFFLYFGALAKMYYKQILFKKHLKKIFYIQVNTPTSKDDYGYFMVQANKLTPISKDEIETKNYFFIKKLNTNFNNNNFDIKMQADKNFIDNVNSSYLKTNSKLVKEDFLDINIKNHILLK